MMTRGWIVKIQLFQHEAKHPEPSQAMRIVLNSRGRSSGKPQNRESQPSGAQWVSGIKHPINNWVLGKNTWGFQPPKSKAGTLSAKYSERSQAILHNCCDTTFYILPSTQKPEAAPHTHTEGLNAVSSSGFIWRSKKNWSTDLPPYVIPERSRARILLL